MNAVVGGLIALAVLILLAVVAVLLVERRRSGRQTPAERYRREVANLQYKPQTWKTKRAAATRAQKHKLWAAGAAGAAGGYVVGTSGTGAGGGSGCGAGGCGGGGCGGGGGGCGGGS